MRPRPLPASRRQPARGIRRRNEPDRCDHRPVRYHGAGNDPVGFDVADFSGEIGASESEAHAFSGARCREVYPSDAGVRMRRAEDRQIKHAGQGYVVDIAPSPREEFAILSSPQRATDIGGRLFGHSWPAVRRSRPRAAARPPETRHCTVAAAPRHRSARSRRDRACCRDGLPDPAASRCARRHR